MRSERGVKHEGERKSNWRVMPAKKLICATDFGKRCSSWRLWKQNENRGVEMSVPQFLKLLAWGAKNMSPTLPAGERKGLHILRIWTLLLPQTGHLLSADFPHLAFRIAAPLIGFMRSPFNVCSQFKWGNYTSVSNRTKKRVGKAPRSPRSK